MSKRIIAALLVTCSIFSYAACKNAEPTENPSTSEVTASSEETTSSETATSEETTVTEETTEESTEETTSSEETSATGATSTSAAAAIGKTTVSDQFKKTYKNPDLGKVTARIPKVTIEGVDTSAVNKEMLNKLKKEAKGNKCSYQYYIGKDYVSIFVELDDHGVDCEWHYIYNISRVTGKKLSQDEMLSVLGLTKEKFRARTKTAIQNMWKKNGWKKGQEKLYKKAISDKTVNSAQVYVNKKGKLSWWVKKMNLGAGADYYEVFGTC